MALLAPPARGQAPAASSEYELVLSRALEAHSRGEYEAARTFMERAHALDPSARTERGLGIVAYAQGRHVAAIGHLEAALASQIKPLPAELRAHTEDLLAHAFGQLERCELQIDPAEHRLSIDGGPPDWYAEGVVLLTPGTHLLEVEAPGRAPYRLDLRSTAGARRLLHLVLAPAPAPKVVERLVDRPVAAPPVAAQAGLSARQSRLVFGISGGALAAAGASLWLVGSLRLDRLQDDCRDNEPSGCSSHEASRRYDGEHIASFSASGIVLASVGAATLLGLGAFELWQLRKKGDKVSLSAGARGLVIHGRF